MIILVDMDNTLAEFDKALLTSWQKLYPDEYFVPLEERRTFHPHKDYPEHLQDKVQAICHTEGFIRSLPPAPGGIEAVNAMIAEGHNVRFCTSHLSEYDHCVLEKYQWIEAYFGAPEVDRIILTRDKTLIRGDLLIDDKPVINGAVTPTWEHILYDRPHNRDMTDKRRLTWNNWRDVVFDGKASLARV
jgi:5'-nucleotidase